MDLLQVNTVIRNQDLTVVLNVYYEISTGHFKISVENSKWVDEPHNSIHIFQ